MGLKQKMDSKVDDEFKRDEKLIKNENIIKFTDSELKSALKPVGTLNQDDLIVLIASDLKKIKTALKNSDTQYKSAHIIADAISKLKALENLTHKGSGQLSFFVQLEQIHD